MVGTSLNAKLGASFPWLRVTSRGFTSFSSKNQPRCVIDEVFCAVIKTYKRRSKIIYKSDLSKIKI